MSRRKYAHERFWTTPTTWIARPDTGNELTSGQVRLAASRSELTSRVRYSVTSV